MDFRASVSSLLLFGCNLLKFTTKINKNSIFIHKIVTTPPKTIVNQDLRLFEANCVPSAVLHFGYEEQIADYFKEEILGKVSSAKACLDKAFEDR